MANELKQDSLNEPMAGEDVRALVRLLGRVAEMNTTWVARKRLLMEELGKLVGGDGWFWSLTRVEGNRPVALGMIHGGMTDIQMASIAISSQSDCPTPEDKLIAMEVLRGKHFTRTRRQIVPDEQWYGHPTVRRHRLEVGIDDFLYSIYPLKESQVLSCAGFHRHVGRGTFTDRDRRLVHIVMSEVDWLHHAGAPDDEGIRIPLLPPRRRMTLILLLDGHDRKAIARLLGISPNTAKEHIEGVYAHFGVSSQVELICRFSRGNGKDLIDSSPGQ